MQLNMHVVALPLMRHQPQAAAQLCVWHQNQQRLLQAAAQLEPVRGGQAWCCGQPPLAGAAVEQHIKPAGNTMKGAGVRCRQTQWRMKQYQAVQGLS